MKTKIGILHFIFKGPYDNNVVVRINYYESFETIQTKLILVLNVYFISLLFQQFL